jgi:sugar phosphate isomerase/epimerase
MPADIQGMEQTGRTLADIRSEAADQGVQINRMDPLNTWSRRWVSDNMPDAYTLKTATTAYEFFRICEGLGCTHASLNAMFPLGSMSHDEITEDYIATCKLGAEHGVNIDLEFVPLWGLPSLEMAWNVVRDADQHNGLLCYDIWHHVRSKSDIETLRSIPGHKIGCVQLSDGPLELPEGQSVVDNCYDRKWPGDGDFPNIEVVKILSESNGLTDVGAEIFSPILEGLSAKEVAEKSRSTVDQILLQAGVPVSVSKKISGSSFGAVPTTH